MFKFAVFDTRPGSAAAEANDLVFAEAPQGVLGIEVTVPALAARCTLGNIDPQHSGGDADRAAIEEVGLMPLPPDGATIATVRADLDSVGAMAVLLARARGESWSMMAAARVVLVAVSDRFSRGGWPGPRPLPTLDDLERGSDLPAPLAAIARAIVDHHVPFGERVFTMMRWLLEGEEPAGYRDQWIAERRALAAALADGRIKTEAAADGRIAVVESDYRAATSVGYTLAPVVVALNPTFRVGGGEPHRKFTICAFEARFADIRAAAAELAALEPGWGGSPKIGGSPQGIGSTLTIEQVVGVVAKHLK